MFETFESDEFAELFEDYESDESDESDEYFVEYDERAGRRRRPAGRGAKVRTAKRGNPVPKKAGPGYATKAELEATANRLDARIATNSKAIQAADTKLRSLDAETGRLGAALKKEVTDRKAETEAFKKALAESRQISMMLPLLSSQTTTSVPDGKGGTISNVVVDNGGSFSKILPMLLLSGGLSGSSSGGDSNSMMPLMLLAMSK